MNRICKDLESQLYDKYQFNFLTPVPRDLLERLAQATFTSQSVAAVERVFDMYSNFICLESDFFTMRQRDPVTYAALNGPGSDAEMSASIDSICDALFSVMVSVGVVPIIRCSPGHAAEHIAKQLDSKLRSYLKNPRNGLFTDQMSTSGSFQRPLLALIDRDADLSTVLSHTWSYQGLVHDLVDYRLNRVTITEAGKPGAEPKKSTYDLDSKADAFWAANRGKQWPEVAEASEEQLEQVKAKEAEIKMKPAGGEGGGAGGSALSDNTAKIRDAVASLPQLMQRKKRLNEHMTLLTYAVEQIMQRSLNEYLNFEEQIMSDSKPESTLYDLVGPSGKGTLEDKLRVLIIYMLSSKPKQDEVTQATASLKSQGCDMGSITYVQDLRKRLTTMSSTRRAHGGAEASAVQEGWGKIFGNGKALLKGVVEQGMQLTRQSNSEAVVTQIIDALMELKATEMTKNYLYLDPKQLRQVADTTAVPSGRSPFDDAIVFVVGGGSFGEYQNIVDALSPKGKNVVYGCSQLVSPTEMLRQLAELGGGGNVAGGGGGAK